MILSGGASLRMGAHKALLKFSDHENFIQHITGVYKEAGIQEITVVKNAAIEFDEDLFHAKRIDVVGNYYPERGRMYSLQIGLANTTADHVFIHNIDNPFIDAALIASLYSNRNNADYIVPCYKGKGGHPILISRSVIMDILSLVTYDETLHDLLKNYSCYRLETGREDCLQNINTPAEYFNHFANL